MDVRCPKSDGLSLSTVLAVCATQYLPSVPPKKKGHRRDTGAARMTHHQEVEGEREGGRRDVSEGRGVSQQVDLYTTAPGLNLLNSASVLTEYHPWLNFFWLSCVKCVTTHWT